MLRPDRRTRRAFAGILVTITALALIWPASFALGRTISSTTVSGPGSAGAPHSNRQPTVHGLGRQPFKANAGEKRSKPLQHLATNSANRGTSDKTRGLRAPAITATPPASVQATLSGAPAATSFGAFEGINQATSTFEPPDPWVAVGPDDVVQSTNTMLRFSNREGHSTAGDVQLFDFFAFDQLVPGQPDFIDGIGDPHWLYDAKHNRWLGTTLAWHCDTDGAGTNDDSLGFVWGAISLTGDPTGDYYQFYVLYNSFLPDFPAVGTSADKFAITANEFILSDQPDCTAGIPFDGGSVTAFDWTQMLTSPAVPDITYQFDTSWFALRPAVQPQSQTNTLFVVGEKLLPSPAGDTTSNVVYMTVTGTNAAGGTTLSAEKDLTAGGVVRGFVDPPVPIQPGGALDPNILDRRPSDAIWQNNVLTVVSTTGCDPAGGAVETRDCARVTQVNTTTSTPTRVQDMLIATPAKDTWYPGAGISQSGILHVVYTQSSSAPAQGMSSIDRYQLPSDAKHTLSAPVTLASGGTLAYTGDRWGDFVGVAQDPRDTNAVWQGNQYTASPGGWSTKVSELQTAGATFKPITPVRLLDSRVNLGTTGPFTSSIPKTIQIAGRLGIPSNAVAITGNLTVTGQQQAGYASLTRVPDANPATSTINFPLGDNRANNITSPLSSAGAVSITYKAGAGKQTHFLLDITGYFLNNATGSTYKVLAPVRVLDSRAGPGRIGLVGPIPANANKEFKVAGVKSVPATAVAVTGNLTIVGQTRGGFVTLSTTAPPTNPTTSTINFPAGDTRANGVTVKLSPTGTLWVVYKSAAGNTTQVIFDVTGYYVNDLTGARFVPLAPGRRMDTRFPAPREGLSGAFSANVARTLVIEPYQGVPVNATAIAGNLTVVNQTRGGYISMTQVATNSPATSTLNFPAGDVRANGVTGPMTDPAGTIGLVYKASSGTTHMILDLTGYFR